jgi:hypothetical protein
VYAEWRRLNSSILPLAFSFASSKDWLSFSRLWVPFSEAAFLCDSWICFAQWEKWSRVSENALAIKTCPTKMWSIQVKGAPKETWGRRQGR